MSDNFEHELLTEIAEAETFGDDELAAEWRLELNSYRAAKEQGAFSGETSTDTDDEEPLGERHSGDS